MSYMLDVILPVEIQVSGIDSEIQQEDLIRKITKHLISSLFVNNMGGNDFEVVVSDDESYLFKKNECNNYIYNGADGFVILITSDFFDGVSVKCKEYIEDNEPF